MNWIINGSRIIFSFDASDFPKAWSCLHLVKKHNHLIDCHPDISVVGKWVSDLRRYQLWHPHI